MVDMGPVRLRGHNPVNGVVQTLDGRQLIYNFSKGMEATNHEGIPGWDRDRQPLCAYAPSVGKQGSVAPSFCASDQRLVSHHEVVSDLNNRSW